ncbi:hypothetical protein LLE87_37540, partial [Paenibacillus polymyxa]|nr:hypothetical protein [Paenibacillus polymyxa]
MAGRILGWLGQVLVARALQRKRQPTENSQQLSASSATLSQNATSASRRNIALYTDCGGATLVRAMTSCRVLT